MLTFALRFPELFSQWGDVGDINACINGLESCYLRYAAKDSLLLLNSGYPRKRKPAKADPHIELQVQEIIKVLPEGSVTAVPTSAELQPLSGVTSAEARSSDDNLFDTSQGVEVPRLIPEEVMEPSGQPDEEARIPEQPSNTDVADIVKAKMWDSLKMMFNGEVWVDESTVGKMCILCGSPHHIFADCKVVNPLRQQITEVFEHIRNVITVHPDTIVFQPGTAPAPQPHSGERASGSNDPVEVESVASSGRKTKAKSKTQAECSSPDWRCIHRQIRVREGPEQGGGAPPRGLQQRLWRGHIRPRLALPVIAICYGASRGARVLEITSFHSVGVVPCIDRTTVENSKIRPTSTLPKASTVGC